MTAKPVVLCILDGWGHREATEHNAIALADTPTWDRWQAELPHALVETSGADVGLPPGQMGNSEVGHMNIGAGRVVMQELGRIETAIAEGRLAEREAMADFIAKLKKSGGTCHLMGLLSPGGVHSHQDHGAALVRLLAEAGVPVAVHAFMDGRDTPPRSGKGFLEKFLGDVGDLLESGKVRLATVSGRYYAMDRDKRWDRVEKAWRAMVLAEGETAPDGPAAMQASYDADTGDEFVLPTVIDGHRGMDSGDGVFMLNFRADRAREILAALLDPAFDGFLRPHLPRFAAALGMTEVSTAHNAWMGTLFPPQTLTHILGQVVAEAGKTQLRLAETEKYAHVTFFLNGGEETVYPGEERILVPSPKVATYDLKPEMSAPEVCDRLVEAISGQAFDLIVVNFANGDMVGHTGIEAAAISAVETLDHCLARIEAALSECGGVALVTADHGNCEMMIDPESGQPHTQHTVGKVPLVLLNGPAGMGLEDGRLADLAPSLLTLMGLPVPAEMTGRPLLHPGAARATA
ncbi:2,3-bisphosphoglycerate-independent phosphoglycerate mutase [Roseospirillum parvum]|uniref:2,3-bisphosphoglycerate-independent phosphoglycerate mutase n=1 Tax=Roseospirillum parvum TaxID=83401 RepID=A0A1G7TQR9_9PROT|nr:2,3-bisphosphoglycerate-independent phosphoglycerate mutase [Roseospirillum parvum]SDG37693.1 2,3-bisphosphoglycerate-independent phosphoglycerate mutase [Roseospirillum parvum]